MANFTLSSPSSILRRDPDRIQQTSRLFGGRVTAIWLLAAMFFVNQAFAQSTFGTFVGTVRDPSGSVVAGCIITATNTGTSTQRTTATDKQGDYVLVNLEPGTYQIVMQSPGFLDELRATETSDAAYRVIQRADQALRGE